MIQCSCGSDLHVFKTRERMTRNKCNIFDFLIARTLEKKCEIQENESTPSKKGTKVYN